VSEFSPPLYKVRSASKADRELIRTLIDNHEYYHHHLDWQSPLDWLDQHPFLILRDENRDIAALACPPSPPGIGWIRLFATLNQPRLQRIWDALLVSAVEKSKALEMEQICGLAFTSWFQLLLENSHFHHHQDVIGLAIQIDKIPPLPAHPSQEIRVAKKEDLPQIALLDARAFDRMWQQTLPSLERAYEQAGYISVALLDGMIIGYQLSTSTATSTHLARLAVEPRLQNQHIGTALIRDLFLYCLRNDIREVTVNTQSDNQASLALYKKLGFSITGENYPVFTYHLT
jgi:ribosomal protein S18 acetylase RimI-like enzyme